jgi:hypothetical protein
MNRRKRNFYWFAGFFVPVVMLSGCALNRVSLVKVTPMTPTSMVIYAAMTRNYPGDHSILNIYVDTNGFPNFLTLTPPYGQEETGLTATLWLVIVYHPETYTSFRVQSGQAISFEGYEIKILRIGEDDQGGYFVEVNVAEAE